MQNLVNVHEVMAAYLYGRKGALVAHAQDDGRAFLCQSGKTAPLFTGTDRGKSDENVLCTHRAGLASFARDHRDPFCEWNHGGSIAVKTTVIHDPPHEQRRPPVQITYAGRAEGAG